jgi:hypothetical protein
MQESRRLQATTSSFLIDSRTSFDMIHLFQSSETVDAPPTMTRMSRLMLCCLMATMVEGFNTQITNNDLKFVPRAPAIVKNSCESSLCNKLITTALHSTPVPSTKYDSKDDADDTMESMIEQARSVAFGDAEYNTHYHPYRDEEERLQQAQFWLQQMMQIQQHQQQQQQSSHDEDITNIAETLEHKIQQYERRIAKRKR